MFHVPSLPAAKRLRATTLTHPAWRHVDDARSIFACSDGSWKVARYLRHCLFVYAISHGSRSTMSLLSISANTLCRLFIRPSGEWSRASMRYQNRHSHRSAFGVADPRFRRCSPIAWLRMPRVLTSRRACSEMFPQIVQGNRIRGGSMPRLFYSHPNQSLRLRKPSSLMVSPANRVNRWRRHGSTWTVAYSGSCL